MQRLRSMFKAENCFYPVIPVFLSPAQPTQNLYRPSDFGLGNLVSLGDKIAFDIKPNKTQHSAQFILASKPCGQKLSICWSNKYFCQFFAFYQIA